MNEDALLLLIPFLGLFWSTLLPDFLTACIRPSPLYTHRNFCLARFRGKDFDRSDGQKFSSVWTLGIETRNSNFYTGHQNTCRNCLSQSIQFLDAMFLPIKTRKQHFWSLFYSRSLQKSPKGNKKSSKRKWGERRGGGMLQQTNRKGKEEGGGKKSRRRRQFPLPPQKKGRERPFCLSLLSLPSASGEKSDVERKKSHGKKRRRKGRGGSLNAARPSIPQQRRRLQ